MSKIKEQVSLQQLIQMYAEKKAEEEGGKRITYISHSQEFGNPELLNVEITLED